MTRPAALSCSSLLEEACARTGLEDWGDLGFTRALELLVESCRATGALSDVGWRALRKNVLRCLENRLHLHAYVTAHPGVAAEPVRAPVVITGLPRAGTTLLHRLLALHPGNRVLRFWEALRPVPPDATNGLVEAELVAEAEVWLKRLYERAPGFRAVHESGAHTPEECDVLFQNAFASWHFEIAFPADAYSEWLHGAALHDEYADYRRQLQLLAARAGSGLRWLLKSPSHLGHLDALLAVLPDVTVVHCHRDPGTSIPSFASLVAAVRGPYSRAVSPAEVGRQWLDRFSAAMGRAIEVRERHDGDRFVDVAYRSLVADPVTTVAALCERLGYAWDGAFAGLVRQWLAENPQHKHGAHRYDLAEFELTRADVGSAFSSYRERFSSFVAE